MPLALCPQIMSSPQCLSIFASQGMCGDGGGEEELVYSESQDSKRRRSSAMLTVTNESDGGEL